MGRSLRVTYLSCRCLSTSTICQGLVAANSEGRIHGSSSHEAETLLVLDEVLFSALVLSSGWIFLLVKGYLCFF